MSTQSNEIIGTCLGALVAHDACLRTGAGLCLEAQHAAKTRSRGPPFRGVLECEGRLRRVLQRDPKPLQQVDEENRFEETDDRVHARSPIDVGRGDPARVDASPMRVASDAPDNAIGQALLGERLSEPVDIDNTPPSLRVVAPTQASGSAMRTTFDVDDVTGKIKRADFSLDGATWTPLFPEDGIADSGHERYVVELPALAPGEHTVSLRAFDGSGNVGTLSVTLRR